MKPARNVAQPDCRRQKQTQGRQGEAEVIFEQFPRGRPETETAQDHKSTKKLESQ
jgi:hypothetical protein